MPTKFMSYARIVDRMHNGMIKVITGIVKSNKEQKTDKVTILKKEEALKAVVEEKINPVVFRGIRDERGGHAEGSSL